MYGVPQPRHRDLWEGVLCWKLSGVSEGIGQHRRPPPNQCQEHPPAVATRNVSRGDQVSPGGLLVRDDPAWRSGWRWSWPGVWTRALNGS